MNRDELLALAERVEKAAGPSYELDCEIWDAIYPGERLSRFEKLTAKGQPYHLRLGPADMDGYVKPFRSFTASIDAALTLASGIGVLISLSEIKGDGMPMCIIGNPGTSELFEAVADTMPLAVCAAALRALAQQENSDADV